jgi:hypothetical protein
MMQGRSVPRKSTVASLKGDRDEQNQMSLTLGWMTSSPLARIPHTSDYAQAHNNSGPTLESKAAWTCLSVFGLGSTVIGAFPWLGTNAHGSTSAQRRGMREPRINSLMLAHSLITMTGSGALLFKGSEICYQAQLTLA